MTPPAQTTTTAPPRAPEPAEGDLTSVERAATPADGRAAEPAAPQLVLDDLLVEDVSIDGMCGVY